MRLRLGELVFDSDARQLLRGRDPIHLSPKAFELLKTLIDQRPRVVPKAELQEHLWPDTFVSEANLASLIAEIRDALGDTARQPRFIRTAHRVGYAFSGDAAESAGDAPRAAGFCWLTKDGKRIPLEAGDNLLGRESDVGIVRIESPTVSRRHARISISTGAAVLEDLQSKNGTFLRGVAVTGPMPLADGDEIRIGSVVLRFRMASASQTATWSETKD